MPAGVITFAFDPLVHVGDRGNDVAGFPPPGQLSLLRPRQGLIAHAAPSLVSRSLMPWPVCWCAMHSFGNWT